MNLDTLDDVSYDLSITHLERLALSYDTLTEESHTTGLLSIKKDKYAKYLVVLYSQCWQFLDFFDERVFCSIK